jgi:hypothetical protein
MVEGIAMGKFWTNEQYERLDKLHQLIDDLIEENNKLRDTLWWMRTWRGFLTYKWDVLVRWVLGR